MKKRFRFSAFIGALVLGFVFSIGATTTLADFVSFNGGNINEATDWSPHIPVAGDTGAIAVDGTSSSTVFNYGSGTIINQTAGTIIADGTNGLNLTDGTWNMSGGKYIGRYFLSNGANTIINLTGGTWEHSDVTGTQHMGAANGGTLNISGSALLDGSQADNAPVQTGGLIDIASAWTGSWTYGLHAGNDWKDLFTNNSISVDGSFIDGATFDSTFVVTNGGQTLAANAIPEPGPFALCGLAGLIFGVLRRR